MSGYYLSEQDISAQAGLATAVLQQQARQFVNNINKKHGLSIDFDKDVDPELVKMIKGNPDINKSNANLLHLTKELFAEKGIEFGKKLSDQSRRRLDEEKKKANMETSGTNTATKSDDSKMTLKEIFNEEKQKADLGSIW